MSRRRINADDVRLSVALGKRISRAREDCGLNQRELAEEAGLPLTRVQSIEQARIMTATKPELLRLAEILKVPGGYFCDSSAGAAGGEPESLVAMPPGVSSSSTNGASTKVTSIGNGIRLMQGSAVDITHETATAMRGEQYDGLGRLLMLLGFRLELPNQSSDQRERASPRRKVKG